MISVSVSRSGRAIKASETLMPGLANNRYRWCVAKSPLVLISSRALPSSRFHVKRRESSADPKGRPGPDNLPALLILSIDAGETGHCGRILTLRVMSNVLRVDRGRDVIESRIGASCRVQSPGSTDASRPRIHVTSNKCRMRNTSNSTCWPGQSYLDIAQLDLVRP
jgi:hypothetical protein